MRQRLLWIAFAACLAVPAAARGQEAPEPVRPRTVVDSVYAVRAAADRLAEGIRRGALDRRVVADAELHERVRGLAEAGARRRRQPPHAAAGPLWDFRLDLVQVRAVNRDLMHAEARASLATDPEGAGSLNLVFRREGGSWRLENAEALTAWVAGELRRLQEGRAR